MNSDTSDVTRLHNLGLLDKAKRSYRAVLRQRPNDSAALNGLGAIAALQGNLSIAELLFRRALAANNRNLDARVNLTETALKIGKYGEALKLGIDTIHLFGSNARTFFLLGQIHSARREHGNAVAAFREASKLDPSNPQYLIGYIGTKRFVCDWSGFDEDDHSLRGLAADAKIVSPLLLMATRSTPAEQLRAARNVALMHTKSEKEMFAFPSRANYNNSVKIKVGYLSCDYYDHATSYLIAELLERHDRSQFEVFGYSFGFAPEDETRRKIASAFDHFIDLAQLSSASAARKINDDKIDILVDLKGYTQGARTDILAFRPAPVQVNFLGYPGTMGADFIDYVIGDRVVSPPEYQPFSMEQIVRMPNCFQPSDTRRRVAPEGVSRAKCGLPEEHFVFCCFCNPYKIAPDVFAIWMRLLSSIPKSVLWLLPKSVTCADNLREQAKSQGVDPNRLIFAPQLPQPNHLARGQLADLVLDTLPVSAFTTAGDALWTGVPILTCLGQTPAGRGTASLLTVMGVPELVTHSLQDYETAALRLATDRELLRQIRSRVAEKKVTSTLFDIHHYTRDLEAGYKEMVRVSVQGLKPKSFDIRSCKSCT